MSKTTATLTFIPKEGKAPESITIDAEEMGSVAKFLGNQGNADAIFQRIQAKKEELKSNKNYLKELVYTEEGAEQAKEDMQSAKETIETIKATVEDREAKLVTAIEDLKREIKEDEELLDAVLLTKMAKAMEEKTPFQLSLFDADAKLYLAHPTFKIQSTKTAKRKR